MVYIWALNLRSEENQSLALEGILFSIIYSLLIKCTYNIKVQKDITLIANKLSQENLNLS